MDDYGIGQRFVQVEGNWISENVRSHLLVILEGETPSNECSGQIPSPKLRPAQIYPVYTMMTLQHSLLQIECLEEWKSQDNFFICLSTILLPSQLLQIRGVGMNEPQLKAPVGVRLKSNL